MTRNYLKELEPANISIEKQIEVLADFLMENFGNEIKEGGAVEIAIRLLDEYRNARPVAYE